MILSRGITLIESNVPRHFGPAQELVQRILPNTGNAVRVGITGVPGVGKSTFIEALGYSLCERGYKMAVLAVDPSSGVSGGSILGDKTRMEKLTRGTRAFIRASPSSGTLEGVTRKSREPLLLCEAAGYDAIVVNKADGNNRRKALVTRADYEQILHYLRPATEGWTTGAYACSALTGDGIDDLWKLVTKFEKAMKESGFFQERRARQALQWMDTMVEEYIHHKISQDPSIAKVTIQSLQPGRESDHREP
ncbi:ArgK protein [Dethiosulfovibrio peptidovorans DSM 11002]|uniref:ArgK protein n=1 Tax=Dethiosulfovibrio peptidovorans DSM 11002 TaxID=469381 RepID=D2Z752_9BACT|nr:ArgK protein [Dethiosulfovibrio peptidovorans]EFC91299.1 ArgK protein [Dethiosulfovibrio peptidovorans DSM 11002]